VVDFVQFVAGGSAEVGVQSQYLDGELHFVDDALSGSVSAREKLKIGQIIFTSLAIDVMDRLFGKQIAPKMFGHDVAVLEHRVLHTSNEAGHRDMNVAVFFDMLFYFAAFKFIQGLRALVLGFAFLIAVFLLSVQATARLAAQGILFTAFYACEVMCSFSGAFSSGTRALHRAVHWFAIEFLFVCSHVGFHHNERLAAFLAREVYWSSTRGGQRQYGTVVTAAGKAAVFSPCFGIARIAVERVVTILTGHFDRHCYFPLFGNTGTVAASVGVVK
jgi:hypothetical protein